MKKFLTGAVLVLLLALPLSALGSTSFSTIVALGDSLTDNGSVTNGTNINPVDVHGFDYYTDGAVWVETLAGAMGSGLWDVAYGGATTGYDNPSAGIDVTGLQWQVDYAIPSGIDGSDTLFTVWAGANDFFQGRGFSDAAANIGTALDKLADMGATSILVPNLPDLGLTPGFYNEANANVTTAQASGWTQAYNQQLSGVLQAFANDNSSVDLYFLDIYSIFTDLILDGNGDIIPIYWSALFWDEVHPTSFGHTIVAAEAYAVLQADPLTPVPLPAAAWLLGTGLIGLIGIRRKMDR